MGKNVLFLKEKQNSEFKSALYMEIIQGHYGNESNMGKYVIYEDEKQR
jgi:hypothetical protein